LPLEKKYIITAVRVESSNIIILETLDKSSTPEKGFIKTAVFRLGTEDKEYEALGEPSVRKTLKVTIEVETPTGPSG